MNVFVILRDAQIVICNFKRPEQTEQAMLIQLFHWFAIFSSNTFILWSAVRVCSKYLKNKGLLKLDVREFPHLLR